jgi:lysozyme family protein
LEKIMADFKEAFENTLQFEDARRAGKVTVDAGGRTRFGIAKKFHPELAESFFAGSAEDALAEAERIEQTEYWAPLSLAEVASQDVANKLFDMAINMGVRQAAVFAQRAANALLADQVARPAALTPEPTVAFETSASSDASVPSVSSKTGPVSRLVEDGVIGPRTLAAINSLDPKPYIKILRELSAEFYRHVASINPAYAVNLAGWMRRAEA